MRPIIYHVATTLDGFIARKDGRTHGFPEQGDHIPDYLESLNGYDTVIMGRKTYTFGYAYGLVPGQLAYPHMRHYIFSGTLHFENPDEKLHVVADNALSVIRHLREEEGTPIYLCGGGNFAGFLLEHRLIDTLLVKQNPVCFGEGLPLFGSFRGTLDLDLQEARTYRSGVLLLRYKLIS